MKTLFTWAVFYVPLVGCSVHRRALSRSWKLHDIKIQSNKFQSSEEAGKDYLDSEEFDESTKKAISRFKEVAHDYRIEIPEAGESDEVENYQILYEDGTDYSEKRYEARTMFKAVAHDYRVILPEATTSMIESVKVDKDQTLDEAGTDYSDKNYEIGCRFKAVAHDHRLDIPEKATNTVIEESDKLEKDKILDEDGADYSNKNTVDGIGYKVDPTLQNMMDQLQSEQLKRAKLHRW